MPRQLPTSEVLGTEVLVPPKAVRKVRKTGNEIFKIPSKHGIQLPLFVHLSALKTRIGPIKRRGGVTGGRDEQLMAVTTPRPASPLRPRILLLQGARASAIQQERQPERSRQEPGCGAAGEAGSRHGGSTRPLRGSSEPSWLLAVLLDPAFPKPLQGAGHHSPPPSRVHLRARVATEGRGLVTRPASCPRGHRP